MNSSLRSTLLGVLALATWCAAQAPAQQCKSIATNLVSNNGGSAGGEFFYDLDIHKASGITVDRMDIDCSAAVGAQFTMEVWRVPGTYLGNETNKAAWTLVSTGNGVAKGSPTPSPVELTDFALGAGSWGIALVLNGAGHRYTNGNGSNQVYMNADMTMKNGAALNVPWTGTPFTPRVWNGTLYYDCDTTMVYCTAKSTLACGVPTIGFTGVPSATAGSGFTIHAGPARTCKAGVLIYNTASAAPGLPFHGGTLCIDPMGLRRAGPTDSMGTPGGANCDGQFSIDMNAFASVSWVVPDCAGNPAGLPPNNTAPFLATPGQVVYTVFWGRDSVATGSFVSDGLRYFQGP